MMMEPRVNVNWRNKMNNKGSVYFIFAVILVVLLILFCFMGHRDVKNDEVYIPIRNYAADSLNLNVSRDSIMEYYRQYKKDTVRYSNAAIIEKIKNDLKKRVVPESTVINAIAVKTIDETVYTLPEYEVSKIPLTLSISEIRYLKYLVLFDSISDLTPTDMSGSWEKLKAETKKYGHYLIFVGEPVNRTALSKKLDY
jgi:hypothetical protein